jgi:hypothetical protein
VSLGFSCRGSNLDESDFASAGVRMQLVTDLQDDGLDAALPLAYDPDAINRWVFAPVLGCCERETAPGGLSPMPKSRGSGSLSSQPTVLAARLQVTVGRQIEICTGRQQHSTPCVRLPRLPHCCCPHLRYWDTRPTAVITRIVQLMSIAGSFISGLLIDVAQGEQEGQGGCVS